MHYLPEDLTSFGSLLLLMRLSKSPSLPQL